MINMIQLNDRPEWLEHRRKYLGGSDCAAVVGMNPYKTNVELWLEKTGQEEPADISGKDVVIYGSNAEKHLRELFALDFPEYSVDYTENNSFLNDKYPFAAASVDGWLTDLTGRRGILEIKTTNISSGSQKLKWADKIPYNYFCQVLFYMAVLEADFAVVKAQIKQTINGNPFIITKHYTIERDDVKDDIDYLMTACREFWDKVEKKEKPALLLPEF